MNVLFVLDHPKSSGGGHVQGLNYCKVFCDIFQDMDDINTFYLSNKYLSGDALQRFNATPIEFKNLKIRQRFAEVFYKTLFAGYAARVTKIFGISFEKSLQKHAIDLVIFLGPSRLIPLVGDVNYIISSWDLSHREDCEFPEVRVQEIYFTRELWIRTFYHRAMCIIVDSDFSKNQLSSWYGIEPKKIVPIPFEPNQKILKKSKGNSRVCDVKINSILVPAQFWSHKGHVWIIEAVTNLRKSGFENFCVNFVGGDRKGAADRLKNLVCALELENYIKFHGFVSDSEMAVFYTDADILLFPSYFGPTNLPPLEGALHNIPVVMPNKISFTEFYGDSFYFFDIGDSSSLSDILASLLEHRPKVNYANFLNKLSKKRSTGLIKLAKELKIFKRKLTLWRY